MAASGTISAAIVIAALHSTARATARLAFFVSSAKYTAPPIENADNIGNQAP